MTPWFRVPVEAWPAIAEALAKPWPDEAIAADLHWWDDRERMGRAARPGRPALRERWGVTDWKAKSMLRAHPTASEPPAGRQPTASQPPAAARANVDTQTETASTPPANHQPATSEPPHARSRQRTEDRGQRTEEEQQGSVDPWAVAAEAWSAIRYEAHVEGRADPVKRRNEAPDSRTRGLGRDLAGIVKHYDLDDVLLVFRWFEHAESAAYLRDSTQKRGLDTIRRHFEKYRNSAREWSTLGEPGTLAVGEHGAGYDDPDDGGWESVAVYLETLHRFGQEPTDADIRDYLAECRSRGETPDPRFDQWTRRVAP